MRRFVLCLALYYFVLVFFSPFSIAITSLGEERASLGAFRTFVRFALVLFYLFPLPLCDWDGLRFVIVAFPGLLYYHFLQYCNAPTLNPFMPHGFFHLKSSERPFPIEGVSVLRVARHKWVNTRLIQKEKRDSTCPPSKYKRRYPTIKTKHRFPEAAKTHISEDWKYLIDLCKPYLQGRQLMWLPSLKGNCS